MIPNSQPKRTHRLARFVTKKTVALLLKIKSEDIKRIECWDNVVYVYGAGVSKFVSYADFPPLLGVDPPIEADYVYWRKRWRKIQPPGEKNQAPEFWTQFFAHQFHAAPSVDELYGWGLLVGKIKSAFKQETLEQLRETYRQERWAWDHF